MAFNRLTANADNNCIGFFKYFELILERTGLSGTARAVVFWIKIYYQVLFAENGIYIEQIPVLIGQSKCWDGTSYFKFVHGIGFAKS